MLFALMLTISSVVSAQKLTISIMPSTGEQRSAYHQLIEKFEVLHPQIDVQLMTYKQENYKDRIENLLDPVENNGDLFFWFGGTRLTQLHRAGYLLDLTPWWEKGDWQKYLSTASDRAVKINEGHFALPINYYQWGFYYLDTDFIKDNKTFSSWPDFIKSCRMIDAKSRNLVSIGSQSTWTVAAWFDYLNLRINGIEFHSKVMRGDVSFFDPQISKVFSYWQQAIDANCFISKRAQLTWKQSLPELYHGKAQSILMGNFFTPILPERIKTQLKFAAFPPIDTNIPQYEEAPMDVIVASKKAKDNPGAYLFLNFLVTTDALSELNKAINKIDPLKIAASSEDHFLRAGIELLNNAPDITQFFDRDSPSQFAKPAMAVFANFLNETINMTEAQSQLETLRKNFFIQPVLQVTEESISY